MPPPFASRTRPVAVAFRAQASTGDVVSLRIPAGDDPVGCVDAALADDGLVEADDAFADQMPTWWVEYADCSAGPGCDCGMTELGMVVDLLAPGDQRAAVQAHLAEMTRLRAHLEALFDLLSGEFGDVCVACLVEPDEHLVDLDTTAGLFARDLVEALFATGLALHVEG